MTVRDPVKNQEYVAKHSKNVREQMGEEAHKKREAEAHRLRRQKQNQTLPPLDMEALKKYTLLCPTEINNLIDLLPPQPDTKQKSNEAQNQNKQKTSKTIMIWLQKKNTVSISATIPNNIERTIYFLCKG